MCHGRDAISDEAPSKSESEETVKSAKAATVEAHQTLGRRRNSPAAL